MILTKIYWLGANYGTFYKRRNTVAFIFHQAKAELKADIFDFVINVHYQNQTL